MAQINPQLGDLTALIESIVSQVLNRSFGEHTTTWAANTARNAWYLSHETGDRDSGANTAGVLKNMAGMVDMVKLVDKANLESLLKKDQYKLNLDKPDLGLKTQIKQATSQLDSLTKIAGALGGLGGIIGAYQSGDAIGGAMSGYQLGKALGFGDPLIGAGIGFLAGLFSPGVDKWYRPKFKPAKQAFDKLFSMDRGERDEYYMPDSYYFRSGYQGPKKIIVKVGNNQFDDHIRESLTNSYASQLQRGLVF